MRDKMIMLLPSVAMLVMLWGIYTVRCYSRGRGIPRCWKCGARKVCRSHARGLFDTLASIAGLNPYRCRGCLTRFYGLRFGRHLGRQIHLTRSDLHRV